MTDVELMKIIKGIFGVLAVAIVIIIATRNSFRALREKSAENERKLTQSLRDELGTPREGDAGRKRNRSPGKQPTPRSASACEERHYDVCIGNFALDHASPLGVRCRDQLAAASPTLIQVAVEDCASRRHKEAWRYAIDA